MDQVIIGVDPHKLSVTIEARDSREILRATGRFGTDSRSYQQLPVAACVGAEPALGPQNLPAVPGLDRHR